MVPLRRQRPICAGSSPSADDHSRTQRHAREVCFSRSRQTAMGR